MNTSQKSVAEKSVNSLHLLLSLQGEPGHVTLRQRIAIITACAKWKLKYELVLALLGD